MLSGILIALDPFYLSDSRVNRAEAVITGLITLSMLALIFCYRQPRWRYVIFSGLLGGLSFLTKIQALAILPAVALIGLFIYGSRASEKGKPYPLLPTSYFLLLFGFVWAVAAGLTWFSLWPAMWSTPLETLTLVYNYTTRKVGAEGVNLFFMGQTYADADPGPIFYPFTFLMRAAPLALLGLTLYAARLTLHASRLISKQPKSDVLRRAPFTLKAGLILVIYILVYTLAMTMGSHKQDRYLLPIFLSSDILAGMGLVYLWAGLKKRLASKPNLPTPYSLLPTPYLGGALFVALLILQLATSLPHHPYYYSYFNPLLGDGPTAVRTMRVGWGEGMDQVGAYLAAKPNSRDLVVASRFTHNMLGFKGEQISLLPDGRWTQADYIVLYIQQVQRRQEPSPGFIDYFQARPAEKIITIGGIDYAWIYPIPFSVPANPEISVKPNQAALIGYRWEGTGQFRLFWENLGLPADRQWLTRLAGRAATSNWAICQPDPAFITQAQTPGAYVESLCAPTVAELPAGVYTIEFALISTLPQGVKPEPEPFVFPEGWQAATITSTGQVVDTPDQERLDAVADEGVPATALRLDRIYAGRIRLLAYQLDPAMPQPGQTVNLILYWQQLQEVLEPVRLTVQLADSRSLPLGRVDASLPADTWLLGEVITTSHQFELAPDLAAPLAAQVEVTLQNQAEVLLQPTTAAGEALDMDTARFTIAPQQWPALDKAVPVAAVWQNGIALRGYTLLPVVAQPGALLEVSLFWEAEQPVAENYVIFVHLLDEAGQIKAQNDDLPRVGAYPTLWWLPGQIVEDTHPLVLPPDLPRGAYQLVVGLYRPDDGARLPLSDGGDSFKVGLVELK